MNKSNWNIGQLCRVCMPVVKQHCNMPPYIRLVQQTIRNAKDGFVMLAGVNEHTGMASIRSHQYDFLGDVSVPLSALIF